MKTSPMAILGVALVFGLAAEASAQKIKITCGPDEYLNMQILGTLAAPNGNVLISDGNEYYNHGSSRNVVVRFQVDNCTHDFTPNLNQSTRSMLAQLSGGNNIVSKFFNFDRVHSVPLTPSGLITDAARVAWMDSPFCKGGVKRTADGAIAINADGSSQDSYAGCGIDDFGNAYVLRAGIVNLEGAQLSFNVSPIDRPAACPAGTTDPVCAASHLRVYHPFDTQWVVRADVTTLAAHRVWVGGKTSAYVFQRYESVPLEIIVNKQ